MTPLAALIRKIENHPRYGPAMLRGVTEARKSPLILNYHRHPDADSWCVSICARDPNPLDIFGKPDLRELVHVKAFGQTEEQCPELTAALSAALVEHYLLDKPPEVFLNGRPYP